MEVPQLLAQLAADGPLLIEAADRAGWDTPVPGTAWDVRKLVIHTGGIHRWAADIVDTASSTPATPAARAVGSGPDDDELVEWFHNGHAALVETLRNAPDDLDCFTFLPADSPRHFWARRQAHETAIHRADAQAAADIVAPFETDFAQDGMAEVLLGFAARKPEDELPPATIALEAADGPSWLITLGERIEAATSDDLSTADVYLRGLSSDLYLWLWNRPCDAILAGDADVAAMWAKTVQIRWS